MHKGRPSIQSLMLSRLCVRTSEANLDLKCMPRVELLERYCRKKYYSKVLKERIFGEDGSYFVPSSDVKRKKKPEGIDFDETTKL